MSNTADEMANRGSKLCMQICVNNITDDKDSRGQKITRKSRKHLLDDLIGLGDIQWLTPLASNSFKEYRLSEMIRANNIPEELLGLDNMNWNFWPSRQPQWDAIGVAPDSSLILVEAKAHKKEVESEIGAINKNSIEMITHNISELLGDNPLWIKKYYQIANRLVFLDRIKKHFAPTGRKVYLVFIYFLNDFTLHPTTKIEWDSYLKEKLYSEIKLPCHLETNIKSIFIDIWNDRGI